MKPSAIPTGAPGRLPEAIDALQYLVRLTPLDAKRYAQIAELESAAGQTEDSVVSLWMAETVSGTPKGNCGLRTPFAPYVGAGNFAVPVSTATSFTSIGGGGFSSSANATSASATAVVTFTYTPAGSAPFAPTLGRTDFDGDGKTDVAVYRPLNGTWYILKSSTNYTASNTYQWGTTGDTPVRGDFDGDGKADVAVYRPSNGTWYILNSSTGFSSGPVYAFGVSSDTPVPGDYDGDGVISR
jgi:hypothetical protein